jgi:uncharacterized protein
MRADRFVVDTSILISAALSGQGKPALVVDFVVEQAVLVFSKPTYEEIATRLMRPKFDGYVSVPNRRLYLEKIAAAAVWVEITGTLAACRDPDDDKILETAVVAKARCIVTGDQDLISLNPFQGIPIVSAATFVLEIMA